MITILLQLCVEDIYFFMECPNYPYKMIIDSYSDIIATLKGLDTGPSIFHFERLEIPDNSNCVVTSPAFKATFIGERDFFTRRSFKHPCIENGKLYQILKREEGSPEMKNKKIFIALTTLIFCLFLMKPSAWAGNVQRNRLEGVAIGVGAVILRAAVINHYRSTVPARSAVNQHPPPAFHYDNRYRQKPSGYWEVRKVWVPPTYRRVWNPGHYNLYGKWVPGQWISIEKKPGYWTQKRVWCRK